VRTLALIALALAPLSGSRLVQANAHMQRLGGLRLDRTPTLGAAIDAFGPPSSCRRIRLEDGSIVRWNALGIRIGTATLGVIPRGETPCTWRGMPIWFASATGRVWTTSLGLRVGDSTARLRRLYPHARFEARNRGEALPRGYWLVTRRTHCIGACGPELVTAPQLIAKVNAGRVAALVFPVFAQGE
jgi:hypothetical protein